MLKEDDREFDSDFGILVIHRLDEDSGLLALLGKLGLVPPVDDDGATQCIASLVR